MADSNKQFTRELRITAERHWTQGDDGHTWPELTLDSPRLAAIARSFNCDRDGLHRAINRLFAERSRESNPSMDVRVRTYEDGRITVG